MTPGTDFRSIRTAIVGAFDEDELIIALRDRMNVRLDHVVKSGNFNTRVFNLLEWAERNGRLIELVRAVALDRPGNAGLHAVYRAYGMAVPLYFEQGGVAMANVAADIASPGFERIVRDDLKFQDFGLWCARMAEVERQVCQITIGGTAIGTGFLVGPEAVLTNFHVLAPVIEGARRSSEVQCLFDFKKLRDGSTMQTPVELHESDWKIDASPYSTDECANKQPRALPSLDELDYSLVRLKEPFGEKPATPNPASSAPPRGWVYVPNPPKDSNSSESPGDLKSPMGVIIAQHPRGWPLKLGIDTAAINRSSVPPLWLNENGTRLRYATNTEGGSSGSPVFDLDWNLIALHHCGDPSFGHAKFNQGIPIARIRERLERTGKVQFLGSKQL